MSGWASSWRSPKAACAAGYGVRPDCERPAALDRLAGKLGREAVRLRFCYEGGPCGYGIQRHLSARGHECVVVAPSLIPKRAGDRVKTDRRDAISLARLHRAGELTAVWVPDPRVDGGQYPPDSSENTSACDGHRVVQVANRGTRARRAVP
jgi:hypothetical protein